MRLFEIVREQPDEAQRLLVIGHNPGLHGFLTRLVGHGDKADLADLNVKFPTAALAAVALEIDTLAGARVDRRPPARLRVSKEAERYVRISRPDQH